MRICSMKTLKTFQISLTPDDTFSHHRLTFLVPDEARRLDITWNYTPKRLTDPETCARIAKEAMMRYLPDEDEQKLLFDYHVGTMESLGNQLCYTLFAEDVFRGCQIHGRETILGEDSASYGFLPGIPHGLCTLVLSVFCVYTDHCTVTFQIDYDDQGVSR